MLKSLYIKNYAIIDELDVAFGENLNAITGETGAGKSILLGALSLILGMRADSKAVGGRGKKCVVEGQFHLKGLGLETFFEEQDLDFEERTLIRREVTAAGKSRAFVNDTPVKLTVLRELSGRLVNVHSQNDTLVLNSRDFQLHVLDSMADQLPALKTYRTGFADFQRLRREFEVLSEDTAKAQSDLDYIRFQLDELAGASLQVDELDTLEAEHKSMTHGGEIVEGAEEIGTLLDGEGAGVLQSLSRAVEIASRLARYQETFQSLAERLESERLELQELHAEVDRLQDASSFDEQRMHEVQERLDALNRLLNKHRVTTMPELIQIRDGLEERLQSIEISTGRIDELREELVKARGALIGQAQALHDGREKIRPSLEKTVGKLLAKLGMPKSRFEIALRVLSEEGLNALGLDEVTYLFSANPGSAAQPVEKVASGGELSRLMLAIKAPIADRMALPTLIFDEIDTGVSGETAFRVGEILKQIAADHQCIIITHLPQIASKADHHYLVEKQADKAETRTRLRLLDEAERLDAVARMIGGEKISAASRASAKELIVNQ